MTTIPQTADAFKAWGDRECGKWPADLQGRGYEAWLAMVRQDGNPQEAFTERYRQWEAARR